MSGSPENLGVAVRGEPAKGGEDMGKGDGGGNPTGLGKGTHARRVAVGEW